MDKLIPKIVALGIPGLILVSALGAASTAGAVGAAVTTTALASIGPGGMIGGIVSLGLIGLIAHALAEYGFDAVFKAVVKEMIEKKTYSINSIKHEIRTSKKYKFMSKSLKLKIIGYLDEYSESIKAEENNKDFNN